MSYEIIMSLVLSLVMVAILYVSFIHRQKNYDKDNNSSSSRVVCIRLFKSSVFGNTVLLDVLDELHTQRLLRSLKVTHPEMFIISVFLFRMLQELQYNSYCQRLLTSFLRESVYNLVSPKNFLLARVPLYIELTRKSPPYRRIPVIWEH